MAPKKVNIEHLEWMVRSRARNQTCSLKLLKLFEEHDDTWKTKRFSRAAQDLLAVSFSLWRAAFLADKTGKRADVFGHAQTFLRTMIEDNAISYQIDRNSNEWTFNYYTRNARASLQQLSEHWKEAPEYKGKNRNARDRWDYCQSLLETALSNFENTLVGLKVKSDLVKESSKRRSDKRRRRRTVRQLTLAGRIGVNR